MNNILIYGPPASGKTYFAQKLAKIFNVQFIDLDQEIVDRTGDSIEDIISMLGESGFRKVESDIFEDLVFMCNNAIISLGGGALLNEDNRKIAEAENTVICLNQDRSILEKNYIKDDKKRPLCEKNLESYRKLLDSRKNHYESFDYQLTNVFLDGDIEIENGLSNIFIGKLFDRALVKLIAVLFQRNKLSIVYDQNVEYIAEKVKANLSDAKIFSGMYFKLEANERNKNIDVIQMIIEQFDKYQMNRNDVVISIGGGITSDLVGFSASIWKRGIRWINIPTTLLSMIDASVGGKTGVNYNDAKNAIGTFHKPACVFIDHEFLLTLRNEEIIEGYSEAYKHFLLDPSIKQYFSINENVEILNILKKIGKVDKDNDCSNQKIIAKFLNTKIKIVAKDPFEKNGERANLNIGHTIAHAIEIKTGYEVSHGNAVSIGICEEMRLALKEGILKDKKLLDDTIDIFQALSLPTELPKNITLEDLMQIMHKDKKNVSSKIKFVFLEKHGKLVDFFM